MKKIMAIVMVVLCFITFMPAGHAIADEDSSRQLIADVIGGTIGGIFELASVIKKANTNPDVNLGKELGTYRINIEYEVLASDGSYKNIPCYFFLVHDKKAGMIHRLGYGKNDKNDMQKIDDFNRMNLAEKKLYLKKTFLQYTKFDVGKIEEDTASSQSITIANTTVPSVK